MQLYQETPDYKDIQVLTKDYGFIDYVFLYLTFFKNIINNFEKQSVLKFSGL